MRAGGRRLDSRQYQLQRFLACPPIPAAPPVLARMREVVSLPGFWAPTITGLLFNLALFIAFAFIVDFATNAGVASSRAALLVGIVGVSSVIGRLGITAFTRRAHVVRLVQGCLAAQPVAFALWYVAAGRHAPLAVSLTAVGVSLLIPRRSYEDPVVGGN